jgi:hypothetical protein
VDATRGTDGGLHIRVHESHVLAQFDPLRRRQERRAAEGVGEHSAGELVAYEVAGALVEQEIGDLAQLSSFGGEKPEPLDPGLACRALALISGRAAALTTLLGHVDDDGIRPERLYGLPWSHTRA